MNKQLNLDPFMSKLSAKIQTKSSYTTGPPFDMNDVDIVELGECPCSATGVGL